MARKREDVTGETRSHAGRHRWCPAHRIHGEPRQDHIRLAVHGNLVDGLSVHVAFELLLWNTDVDDLVNSFPSEAAGRGFGCDDGESDRLTEFNGGGNRLECGDTDPPCRRARRSPGCSCDTLPN